MDPRSRELLHPVPRRARAPRERVVERVEVCALRDRRPALVERSVVGEDVAFEPGGHLDRAAVSDSAVSVEIPANRGRRGGVAGILRDRDDPGLRLEAGLEGGVDALLEVERLIPGRQILEDVREVHVRPVQEVAARPEIHVAERFEVRDPARPERGLLGRGEPEEELRIVRDQVCALDTGRLCHALRQTRPGAKVAPDETTADARCAQDP